MAERGKDERTEQVAKLEALIEKHEVSIFMIKNRLLTTIKITIFNSESDSYCFCYHNQSGSLLEVLCLRR